MTTLIEYLSVLLEYLDLLLARWQAFGKAWVLPGMPLAVPLFESNVSHVSLVSAILVSVLCLCTAYNSGIILTKIVTLLFLTLCWHIRHKPTLNSFCYYINLALPWSLSHIRLISCCSGCMAMPFFE